MIASLLIAAAAVTLTIRSDCPPVNTFVPQETFGAGVDGRESGDAPRTFTEHNIALMRSAGFTQLTYRLRTELGIEAWHWNPRGTWSDAARERGYWTSSDTVGGVLPDSYGYRLPRRGTTIDQANNDGYSRIDDGDLQTLWKSNPYLDESFTHESNDEHPQWIAIKFAKPVRINAVRIAWAEPFAAEYSVEYCSDRDASEITEPCWTPFAKSRFTATSANTRTDVLSRRPVTTKFVRILLTRSCNCAPSTTSDVRDRLGYAVREIEAGVVDRNGRFHDAIRHSRDRLRQTNIVVSSTDPWHTANDRDPRIEQPSFDRVEASGLTAGAPMLVPAGLLFDTPENAAAEISWLMKRGYPVTYVEEGEEPDGQFATPEDYGALFIEFADAIHKVAPGVKLGGPSFQVVFGDYFAMPLRGRSGTWFHRFLAYLARRGRSDLFTFFSFEWYPFDEVCAPSGPQLEKHASMLRTALRDLRSAGLTRSIPWFMTEYGYSAFSTRKEVDIEGAILNAESVGLFLTLGGSRAYLYGLEPNVLLNQSTCSSWGNNAMFICGPDGQASASTAIYQVARLVTEQWVVPGKSPHDVFVVDSTKPLLAAYAVRRPDQRWGLLVVNKDPDDAYETTFASPADVYRYSREEYAWKEDGERGHPVHNDPPRFDRIPAGRRVVFPPYSISVVRLPE